MVKCAIIRTYTKNKVVKEFTHAFNPQHIPNIIGGELATLRATDSDLLRQYIASPAFKEMLYQYSLPGGGLDDFDPPKSDSD
jgi:hypothetical protein